MTLRPWLRAAGVVGLCTLACELLWRRLDPADIIMVYLAGVAFVAWREGIAVSVATVAASILLFDFLYVAPRFGLNPVDKSHFITFGVMLAVGLLIARLAEQARRSAAAQMEAQEERLRSTLLSSISHDFRTPLTAIVGAASTLLEQDARLDPEQRRSLARSVRDEAQRLHGLMSDLLDLTRLEEGAVQLAPEWCPADELVQEALAAVGPRAASHRLATEVPPDGVVWCDARLVQQAIVNLVDNALRHTPAGTPVRIAIAATPGHWTLVVHDAGPGLPPGAQEAVFRKFHHGHAAHPGTGTGLGLAICAAVARVHGGSIRAENAAGARFTMTMPQPATVPVPPTEE